MMDSVYKKYLFILSLFTIEWLCDAVDRGNFKSCEQSSFCRRHRRLQPGLSRYEVLMDTFSVSETGITVNVLNNENSVRFFLEIFPLDDSTFRVKFNERNPLFTRYEEPYSLLSDIKSAKFEVEKDSSKGFMLKSGDNAVSVVNSPLRLDFFKGSHLAVSINAKGLLMFEHYRKKRKNEAAEENNADSPLEAAMDDDVEEKEPVVEEPEEDGMWEEDFKGHRDSKPRGPASLGVDVAFLGSQHVYGIPEHADAFSLKSTGSGDPYRLYNLDVFEYELDNPMALYGSVPFMVSHSRQITTGLFWHNAAETWIDVKHLPDKDVVSSITGFFSGSPEESPHVSTHWMSESGVMDIFVLLGDRPADVFRQYSKLTGTTPLPPIFSLGYHQCRWNYNDMADVQGVHDSFDKFNLPMDVMWLDIEHADGKRYFTWDHHKFSNPLEMTKNLTDRGRKLVTIVDPHIKKDSGYEFYQENLDRDFYIKDSHGSTFEGWCWPGQSSYIDFTLEEARNFYADYFNLDKYKGSTLDTFIWNDMNEPSVFNGPEITLHKDALHFKGAVEHRDMHNVNGLLFHSATYEGLLRRSGGRLRPFVLTRAHFAGTQRTSAVWTGDNRADWGHLRISVPMILSQSISGITHIGADVGGFFGDPSPELLLRWYQAAAFTTFYRAHAHIDTKRREPWLFGEGVLNAVREAIRDHYRLLPYIYTLFYENELTGAPPIRPLWMEFPSDEDSFGIDWEYLLGPGLLVRPIVDEGARSASVYFPHGPWFDWKSGRLFVGPSTLTIDAPLHKIPVFQRGGSIIARKERPRRSSAMMKDDPITLFVALDAEGKAEGSLYFDDEHTMDYRQGKFLFLHLSFIDGILTSRIVDPNGSFHTKVWLERVVIFGLSKAPNSIELFAGSEKPEKLTATHKEMENGAGPVLVIRKPEKANFNSLFKIALRY